MRLELTLCNNTIKKYFTFSRENINLKSRIDNNILVVSEELIELWENSCDNELLKNQFKEWFYGNVVLTNGYIKKVKLQDLSENINEKDIIIETCDLSIDKILVAESNIIQGNKKTMIRYINNSIFNMDKKQRIKVQDINNIIYRRINNDFFSIYETPITIDVTANSDSKCLAEYLSLFYNDSKNITIKDVYLDNEENLRNFKKYVLPFIKKEDCKITLLLYWKDGNRKNELERVFKGINGYNIEIKKLPSSTHLHDSFIEGDNYKINIGYRLKLFGDKDDGLTEQDIITITRK
ncbi:MAG: hypothetical protein E7D43_09370 [Clostridium perfringens]|nr:hypothetical protein [Clostridium perfringens]